MLFGCAAFVSPLAAALTSEAGAVLISGDEFALGVSGNAAGSGDGGIEFVGTSVVLPPQNWAT